jgi:MarR family transcriptional regulator, 2-MHQ and catechol-resistance regulon repressor
MDAKHLKSRTGTQTSAPHVWLVIGKALNAMVRHMDAHLQRCGLSNTDFRVLEALLHKGPLPVNVIGPKVQLTAGAISIAVDRLQERGLVQREEGKRDRRVRTVALTKEGEKIIVPVYRRHEALLERLLEPLTEPQRASLESMMKTIGKNAETLGEMPDE